MPQILGHITTLAYTVRAVTAAVAANTFVAYDDRTAGADAPVQGVAKNDAAIGDALALTMTGIVEMKAATAIAKGALVYSDAAGLPTSVGANFPVGRAIRAAVNPGDIVTIRLAPR